MGRVGGKLTNVPSNASSLDAPISGRRQSGDEAKRSRSNSRPSHRTRDDVERTSMIPSARERERTPSGRTIEFLPRALGLRQTVGHGVDGGRVMSQSAMAGIHL